MYCLIGYPILPGKCGLVAAGLGQTMPDLIYLFICQLAGTTALVSCGGYLHRAEGEGNIHLVTITVIDFSLYNREASGGHSSDKVVCFLL